MGSAANDPSVCPTVNSTLSRIEFSSPAASTVTTTGPPTSRLLLAAGFETSLRARAPSAISTTAAASAA